MDKILEEFRYNLMHAIDKGHIETDREINKYTEGFIEALKITRNITLRLEGKIYDMAFEIKEFWNLPYGDDIVEGVEER